MFGIKKWEKKETEKWKKIKGKSNEKIYVEIKPETEIVRVENEEQLRLLNKLEEVKTLQTTKLPQLKEGEVCAHWEREIIFLSEVNGEEFLKTRKDAIVGGYCPDCGKSLGQPKADWIPKISYKTKNTGV